MNQKFEFDTIFYMITKLFVEHHKKKNEIYTFLLYDECNTGFSYNIMSVL